VNDVVISINNLSKAYKLYGSPHDRLKEALNPLRKSYHRDFYALRDVSFDVKRGETVAIVGRNGSGKSTLLKIITNVLTPTSGSVQVNGRISALLELGGGFNPQLSGFENVFFSGMLMGYRREEMASRLDDILAFADIGDFIHQPVRSYSSGMFVRLGFAVATCVDPDILIVDEALSVGDEAFQRKCFARIERFREQGKTILFVSHNAHQVVQLCQTAHLFDAGELLLSGTPKPLVARYQKLIYAPADKLREIRRDICSGMDDATDESGRGGAQKSQSNDESSGGESNLPPGRVNIVPRSKSLYDPHLKPKSTVNYESRGAVIENPQILTPDGQKANILVRGEDYVFSYKVRFSGDACKVRFGMLAKTITGLELGGMTSHAVYSPLESVDSGSSFVIRFPFRCVFLKGTYFLNAGVAAQINDEEIYLHRIVDALMFRVQPEKDLLPNCLVDISVPDLQVEVEADG